MALSGAIANRDAARIMSRRRNPRFLVGLLYNRSIKKIGLLGEPGRSRRRASIYGVSASAAPLSP